MSMEKDLWSIFTYATLYGNPLDPSQLSSNGLLKICRDSMLFDESMTDIPTTQAQVHLIFAAELKRGRDDAAKASRLGARGGKQQERVAIEYDEFLSCLVRIAQACYPTSSSLDNAMKQLLLDNVLPLALRRGESPHLEVVWQSADIVGQKTYWQEPLLHLFEYYSSLSSNKARSKQMVQSMNDSTKSFDDHQHDKKRQQSSSQGNAGGDSGSGTKSKASLDYPEWLRFCNDFGFQVSMGLTSIDVGDVYLTVISKNDFTTRVRSLTFGEFWEVLVGCSQKAFRAHHVSDLEKLKCLFFYMWRSIEVSMSEQMKKDAVNLSTTKGGLIRGAQLLNSRFTSQWAKDEYRDYTSGGVTTKTNATTLGGHDNNNHGNKKISIIRSGNSLPANTSASASSSSFVDISADSVLGDERIDPLELRSLLDQRPDLLQVLRTCLSTTQSDTSVTS